VTSTNAGTEGTPERKRREPKKSKLIVVLPVYNEASNIGPLLDKIDDLLEDHRNPYQLVAVDDGSQDATPQILEKYKNELPLSVYAHSQNLGLGATIRDGLHIASKMASDNDVVITMDADETHAPGLILRMSRMILEGHDVVIASRYQPGARVFGLSRWRRFLSYAANLLFRFVFPTAGVRDFTCGYRAYRGDVLHRAIETYGEKFVDAAGFQCMIDILLKLRNLHVVFGEVPMILRYDLKQGKSKMRVGHTIVQSLALLVARRLGR
jgi:dolichol-phosphate mannosyltransferase